MGATPWSQDVRARGEQPRYEQRKVFAPAVPHSEATF